MQVKMLKLAAVLLALCAVANLVQFLRFDTYLVQQESFSYRVGQVFGKLFRFVAYAAFSYLFWLKANKMQKARA